MTCAIDIQISETPFDPEAAQAGFRKTLSKSGAVAAFTGVVRGHAGNDQVETLELSHYPGFTEKQISAICKTAAERWPLEALLVIHRVGVMSPSEPIVLVAAASAHRRAAFEAADYLMDYLKSDAAFWKKETRAGEAHWIEPRAEDYADKARWAQSDA
ncbi:MAG: molybdenum cofactor biosynthesis protein MoaE [Pseudomonadota bacterium]